MKEQIQVMISEEEVNARISEIAAQISEDFKGEEILVIGILRGGVYFCTELTKKITVPVILDFMEASSYGAGTESRHCRKTCNRGGRHCRYRQDASPAAGKFKGTGAEELKAVYTAG